MGAHIDHAVCVIDRQEGGSEALASNGILLLVAGRQRRGGHQDAAKMLDRLAVGQIIEGGVVEWALPGGELSERRGDRSALEPGQDSGRAIDGGQRFVEDPQFGTDLSTGVGEQIVEPLVQVTAAAGSGAEASARAAAWASLPEALAWQSTAVAVAVMPAPGPQLLARL